MSIKRITSFAAIVASLLAIAGVAPGSADDFLIHPGQISGSGSFGFAQGFDESTSTNFFVELQTGLTTFRIHDTHQLLTIDTGVVNLSFSNFSSFGFGCWMIPKQDFAVQSDMTATLTLDTSAPGVSECPGDPVENGVLGAAPTLGPSGQVFGLDEPLQLTVTWSPAAPVTTTRTTSRMSCKPFQSIGEGVSKYVDSTTSGSATLTFTGSQPYTATFAGGTGNVTSGSGKTEITGPPSAGCGPF